MAASSHTGTRSSALSNPSPIGIGLRTVLKQRQETHEQFKRRYFEETAAQRELLLKESIRVRDALLADLFRQIPEGLTTPRMKATVNEFQAYARRCDWGLLDLVALAAAASDRSAGEIASLLAPRLTLYHSFRMIDDVLDDHFNYKGGLRTALGAITDAGAPTPAARAANVLGALMMAVQTVPALEPHELSLVQQTLRGALSESLQTTSWSLTQYREMVAGKMVSYGMILYGPIKSLFAPAWREPLQGFLKQTFYVSQLANDLGDRPDDQARGQPNFWNLELEASHQEEAFRKELDELEQSCRGFQGLLSGYAHTRMADLLRYTLSMADRVSS